MTDTRTGPAPRPAPTQPGGRAGKAPTGSWPVRERSLVKPVLGIPPVAAVGIAVGLTALGVLVDLLRLGTVGSIFEVGYFLGCVLAVTWVRRRSIFVPAIQPPLLLAVVVPVIAVLIGAPTSEAGTTEHLLMAGAPLVNAFPAMAVTTLVVLLLAGFRLWRQRTGPNDAAGQVRRRLSRGRTGDSAPDGDTGRDRASARATGSGTDRARPRSGATRSGAAKSGATGSGATRSGSTGSRPTDSEATRPADRGSSGRTRRTSAPDDAAGPTGTGTSGASARPGSARPDSGRPDSGRPDSGRTDPRTGAARSTPGAARADEPPRPRRPRRS
ncbi:MAG: hypothetical protein L0I76_30265 [Pseudonocardia sp.]|nr:hypothetical protein [Pseudonocardia sp.]